MDLERSLKIVRGHAPWYVPVEAASVGLDSAVALVLRTHRTGADGMVFDHELWLACVDAVTRAVRATTVGVFGAAKRRFLERFRRHRLGASLGSLGEFRERLRGELMRRDEDAGAWQTVLWRKDDLLVATASCEQWFAIGGPAPYHDSYTSSVLLRPRDVDQLVREVASGVERVGGQVDEIVDLRKHRLTSRCS